MARNRYVGSSFDDFLRKEGLHEDCLVGALERLPNIHPGTVLLQEFMEPRRVSRRALARAAKVPQRRIGEIIRGKRGISGDTAVRLAAVLGTSERFWLGLQADHDLEEAHRTLGASVSSIRRIVA